MEKVYVVISDIGFEDNHHQVVLKCFKSKNVAEKYAEKYVKIISKLKYLALEKYELIDEHEYQSSSITLTIFDQAIWAKYRKFQEFNECIIQELDFIT